MILTVTIPASFPMRNSTAKRPILLNAMLSEFFFAPESPCLSIDSE